MVSEGKAGKYLKYAIGEIVLVVIGILVALQINNWAESRKQAQAEREFIASVKNDLKQDQAFIQRVIEVNEPRVSAYKILNSGLVDLYQNDREALDSTIDIYFKYQRTFYPISGTYESAVSGNQITVFKNKALLQKVVKLYNSTYNRLVDNGKIWDERWDFLSKKYSYERRTGHFRDRQTEELSEFLDDLYHHYIQMEWYLQQLRMAVDEIDMIIGEKG